MGVVDIEGVDIGVVVGKFGDGIEIKVFDLLLKLFYGCGVVCVLLW